MLMGEHAVLQGKRALSCAVNKRIHVHKKARDDDKIIIHSALGKYSSTLSNLIFDPRFSFVLACLEGQSEGLELTIESEFSHTVGLGSSAAVSIATLGCLHGPNIPLKTLFEKSLKVIRKVQKIGSGADVAASIFGGCVLYRMEPQEITPITAKIPLTLVYSGSKMATQEVIRLVLEKEAEDPIKFKEIFLSMDVLVSEAVAALQDNDLIRLGVLFNSHHDYQVALGTCNDALAAIVARLRASPTIFGAKISGSGLGDCAVGLGSCSMPGEIPIEISKQGVCFYDY